MGKGVVGFIPGLEDVYGDVNAAAGDDAEKVKEKNTNIQDEINIKDQKNETREPAPEKKDEINKQKKGPLRAAGGVIWQDESLADWDPKDFRIFVGDLGRDVTDDVLRDAFLYSYPSVTRVRVVRDKRTGRSKGFGFVAMSDEAEFKRAMREMHGKYIGSRPVKLRKSNWADRSIEDVDQVRELKSAGYHIASKKR